MTSRSRDRVADVRSVVVAHMPDYWIESVAPLGEGLDNLAYEVNGELIVRFSKEPDLARRTALVSHEARVLAAVADISPLPVPEPAFTVAEQGCLAYRKLPGTPLLDMPRHRRSAHGTSIAATLGELLAALHAVPVDRLAGLVEADHQPPAEWRHVATENYATVAGRVPVAHRGTRRGVPGRRTTARRMHPGVLPQRSGDRARSDRPGHLDGDRHHRLERRGRRRSGP